MNERENFDEMRDEDIRVLIVEADKHPYVAQIPNTLEIKQEIVGGYIEAVYPFNDEVAVICNEEAKLIGCEPNRVLFDAEGEPYDILCGTFIVAGLTEEDFGSLSEELLDKYERRFYRTEFYELDVDREVTWNEYTFREDRAFEEDSRSEQERGREGLGGDWEYGIEWEF